MWFSRALSVHCVAWHCSSGQGEGKVILTQVCFSAATNTALLPLCQSVENFMADHMPEHFTTVEVSRKHYSVHNIATQVDDYIEASLSGA